MQSMPLPTWPRLMMVITGPVVGIMSGILIGALALIIGHFLKPTGPKRGLTPAL
jgi:hypothetical protein